MLRTIAATAFTVVTLALLGVQFASMLVDGGVLPTPITTGACSLIMGSIASGQSTTNLDRGDVVSGPRLDRATRLFLTTGSARAGSTYNIPVSRDGRQAVVTISMPSTPPWTFWLIAILSKLVIYCVGALVLWRGRDAAAVYFGVASLAISVAIYPTPSSALDPGLQLAYVVIARSFADVAAFFLYLMVEVLARDALPTRAVGPLRALVVAGILIGIADNIVSPVARVQTGCVNSFLATAHPAAYMTVLAVTLIALTLAFFRSTGEMRRRLRWIYASTFVGFTGVIAYLGGQTLNRPIPAYPVMNITAVAIPIGYAYAILRHHVIDVGFAINRAIIFTAMTTIVVGAFALLSSALERLAVGPGESVAFQVAVALALALSFNALEKRVEAAIDRIFFRKKHQAEASLTLLADEAPFMHSADALLERVVNTVRNELGCDVAVYHSQIDRDYERVEASGEGFPSLVHIDDPAFVRLRTYLRDVDLDAVDSNLGKDGIAFPLAVQGRLNGALVCGTRSSEEAFDPDERACVRALAARVAASLQALHAREHALLVKAIAEGAIDIDEARTRARSLLTDQ